MAAHISADLRQWVETNTTFPNTMVDRITPMTEVEHIELVARYCWGGGVECHEAVLSLVGYLRVDLLAELNAGCTGKRVSACYTTQVRMVACSAGVARGRSSLHVCANVVSAVKRVGRSALVVQGGTTVCIRRRNFF